MPEFSKLAFTLYKGGGHDAWSRTYKNQDMWDWMFQQQPGLAVGDQDWKVISRVYPNPTSGRIRIESTDKVEKHIEIYNITGRKLYSGKLTTNYIDLGAFGKGVYFLRLSSNSRNETFRVVVQ